MSAKLPAVQVSIYISIHCPNNMCTRGFYMHACTYAFVIAFTKVGLLALSAPESPLWCVLSTKYLLRYNTVSIIYVHAMM